MALLDAVRLLVQEDFLFLCLQMNGKANQKEICGVVIVCTF